MAILVALGLFVALMAAIGYFGYMHYARPGRVYEQLGGQATFAMPGVDRQSAEEPGLVVRVFEQIGEKIPISPEDASLLRQDLIAAGFKSEYAPHVYLASRILGCIFLVAFALLLRDYITS